LPWTTLRSVCEAAGADLDQIDFDYVGTNHIGWFYRIACGARDLVVEYATSLNDGEGFPPRSLIESLGAVPLKYLRLHYCSQAALGDQLAQTPRARVLDELDHRASRHFAASDADTIHAIISVRPTPWYSNAVAPLIAGWLGAPVAQKLFLSMRNQYHVADLMPSDVIEIPCQFVGGKLVRRSNLTAPPAHVLRTLHNFTRYERAAASAVVERNSTSLEWAIALHPWLRERSAAAAIAADVRAGEMTIVEAPPLSPVTSYYSN
jgi:6-phospho-beta-glucosidase